MHFKMNRLAQSLLLAFTFLIHAEVSAESTVATVTTQEPSVNLTGREIFDAAAKRHALPFEYAEQVIILHDHQGNTIERKMNFYSRKGEDGLHKFLLIFLSPEGVKGVSLLMLQGKDEPDSQFLYLPSGGEPKRILQGAKKNYFMGTDFAFEDLSGQNYDDFKCQRQADQEINGKKVFVIDVTPANEKAASESGYKSRRIYILQDIYQPLKIEFFDRRGALFKEETFDSFKNVQGEVYRPEHVTMRKVKVKVDGSLDEESSTEIKILKGGYTEDSVPSELFLKRNLPSVLSRISAS